MFLLRCPSDTELRRSLRAKTVKIETIAESLDCIAFGDPVSRSGDPVEQEKSPQHACLVANAVMLFDVVDMGDAIEAMVAAGETVTPELLSATSLNPREHIRRFSQYVFERTDLSGPLDPRPPPLAIAL